MRFSSKTWIVLSAFFLAFVIVPASHAQLNSNNRHGAILNAILSESLTVVAGPATVNFTPWRPTAPRTAAIRSPSRPLGRLPRLTAPASSSTPTSRAQTR